MWRPWEDVQAEAEPVDSESGDSSGDEDIAAPAEKTRRPTLDNTFQQAIFDVYNKAVRDGSSRPITDVCETLQLASSVVHKVLRRGQPVTPRKRGPKKQFVRVDGFDQDRIKNIVYDNYRNRKVPTVQELYDEVKENLPEFPYSRATFYRLLRKMNFRFKKIARKKVAKFTARIRDLQARYVAKIQEY